MGGESGTRVDENVSLDGTGGSPASQLQWHLFKPRREGSLPSIAVGFDRCLYLLIVVNNIKRTPGFRDGTKTLEVVRRKVRLTRGYTQHIL